MPHTHTPRPINDCVIHCQSCNLVLAGLSAGLIIVRRDRTEIVAERVHSIRCHRCGENNSITPISTVASNTSSHFQPSEIRQLASA